MDEIATDAPYHCPSHLGGHSGPDGYEQVIECRRKIHEAERDASIAWSHGVERAPVAPEPNGNTRYFSTLHGDLPNGPNQARCERCGQPSPLLIKDSRGRSIHPEKCTESGLA